MIKQLKKRPRADTLENEERSAKPSISRRVYLGLLLLFGIAVVNYLWGDNFILRGDGLIVRDTNTVASTFVARVESIDVKEGQQVREGDVLLRVGSEEILERIADLSLREAELSQKIADLQLRHNTSRRLLPLAEKRESSATKFLQNIEEMAESGLVTAYPDGELAALGAGGATAHGRVQGLHPEGLELGVDGTHDSRRVGAEIHEDLA